MSLEKRLAALEEAHRALHARHEALMMATRVILPFMCARPTDIRKMSVLAYDALNEHMEKNELDEPFQLVAREAMHEVFGPAIAAIPIVGRTD
jgi:hypothetical protein